MAVKLIALLFFVFMSTGVYAQNFFIAPLVEAVYFGRNTPAIMFGGIIGADGGFTIAMRFTYGQSMDEEDRLTMLEMQFLARFYVPDIENAKGFFLQLNGGPVLVFPEGEKIKIPAEIGTMSAGLTVGWRFLIAKHFFVDAYVRGGYPYLYGGGLSAGFRM